MALRSAPSLLRPLFALLLVASGVACEVVTSEPAVAPVVTNAPAWVGTEQDLFPDGIDPAAVGLALDAAPTSADSLLQGRAPLADLIARVRVVTVTAEQVGDVSVFRLGLDIVATMGTPRLPRTPIELTIGRESPAYALVRNQESRLRGKQFVAFFRRYASSASGDAVLHWHLAADTPEVEAAVKEAIALQELRGL